MAHPPSGDIHAQFLIGADGARSRVAERFGLGRNRHFLTGVEIECEPLSGVDERFLHCFADSEIAPGYIAWVVPGVGATQQICCLAAQPPASSQLLGALAANGLKTHYDIREIRVTSRRSGLIPSGGMVKNIGTNRVALVGDAAGMVSPVTGGGIHTALHFLDAGPPLVRANISARGGRIRWPRSGAGSAAVSRQAAAAPDAGFRPRPMR